MPDPTLYLFDGYNLLHAGSFSSARELTDSLASFVALRGARGILVFDGIGADESLGRLEIRYAPHADALLERLAVANRERERVCLVSSDAAIRGTSGELVAKLSSAAFVAELRAGDHRERSRSQIADRIDEETRTRLERLRRSK